MKLFRLLIIVPALFLQLGCGSNSSNPSSQYYMGSNGSCMSTGGQVVPSSYCSSAYGAYGAGQSQVCQGSYLYCANGPGSCIQGQCTAQPDNCGGHQGMFTPSMQPVNCL